MAIEIELLQVHQCDFRSQKVGRKHLFKRCCESGPAFPADLHNHKDSFHLKPTDRIYLYKLQILLDTETGQVIKLLTLRPCSSSVLRSQAIGGLQIGSKIMRSLGVL